MRRSRPDAGVPPRGARRPHSPVDRSRVLFGLLLRASADATPTPKRRRACHRATFARGAFRRLGVLRHSRPARPTLRRPLRSTPPRRAPAPACASATKVARSLECVGLDCGDTGIGSNGCSGVTRARRRPPRLPRLRLFRPGCSALSSAADCGSSAAEFFLLDLRLVPRFGDRRDLFRRLAFLLAAASTPGPAAPPAFARLVAILDCRRELERRLSLGFLDFGDLFLGPGDQRLQPVDAVVRRHQRRIVDNRDRLSRNGPRSPPANAVSG